MVDSIKSIMSCRRISKSFGGVKALEGIDFDIYPGVINGLVGENGAGKSTLMKIFSGVYKCSSGDIIFDNSKIVIHNPDEMIKKGVSMIYQDFNLIESMSVLENIFLNNEYTKSFLGLLKNKEMYENLIKTFNFYNFDIEPNRKVGDLPNDIKKIVQIIKAIRKDAKVLIMDEPTSSLTTFERDRILEVIRSLAKNNIGIVFISHYLSEVFNVCDTITVLREGKKIAFTETKNTSIDEVINWMIGKKLNYSSINSVREPKKEISFSIKNISAINKDMGTKIENVSFDLRKGEVLGITGLVGSGTNEVAKIIIGSLDIRKIKGQIFIRNRETNIKHPENAVNQRMAYITNDRMNEGLIANFPIYENICLPILRSLRNRVGLLNQKKMLSESDTFVKLLQIKTTDSYATINSLSGGNQQKVLIAKSLAIKPDIIIMNEPTIGIDIGTKFEVRKLISKMAKNGVSILLLTNELEELVNLCNRVLIMFRGVIIEELPREKINNENILRLMDGGTING